MKISRPFKNASVLSITQGFHKDHQANDFGGKFGEFLVAPFNGKVLNITGIESDQDTPDEGSLSNGYGIRIQSTEDPTLSCTYWHCQPIFLHKKGDIVLMGQIIAMMGNSGFVLGGGTIILDENKLKPPYPGTHLHWSMGQQIGQTYVPIDPSTKIDWQIPIKYNLIEIISLYLKIISKFLIG